MWPLHCTFCHVTDLFVTWPLSLQHLLVMWPLFSTSWLFSPYLASLGWRLCLASLVYVAYVAVWHLLFMWPM